MQIVFLPSQHRSGRSIAIAKSHVAKLAAERRRISKERLALECLDGAPLPAERLLLIKLPGREQVNFVPNIRDQERRPCNRGYSYEDIERQYPHPVTNLGKGNSDPFNTAVLVIDATANELLVFNRECFVPWINSMEKGKNQEASYNNKFVQTNIAALHDETTAHASLASLAMVLANATGSDKYRLYALHLIRHAYRGLRMELASSPRGDRAAMRMFALFRFEIMAHNPDAAAVHIQALQNLLVEQRRRGQTLNPILLSAAGWNDNVRSLRFLSPPIFNLELLRDTELLDDVHVVARVLEKHGFVDPKPSSLLAQSGIPPRTRELYMEFIRLLRIGRAFNDLHAQRFLTHRTANSWARTAAILANKLNCVYHGAQNRLLLGFEDPHMLHRESATALAAVYWAFAVSNFEFLDLDDREHWKHGYPTLSVSATVLSALSIEIEAIDWSSHDDAPPSLRLWLTYIASLAEQAIANFADTTMSTGYKSRHNLEFVAQARSMGMWYWTEVQEELGRYLYFADKGPASRHWFERAMAEYEDSAWRAGRSTAGWRGSEEPEHYSTCVRPLLSAYDPLIEAR